MPLNDNPTIGYLAGLTVHDWAGSPITTGALDAAIAAIAAGANTRTVIPNLRELVPDGTRYGEVRETHLASDAAFHEFGAGWADARNVTATVLYSEFTKGLLLSLEPRAWPQPLALPAPAGVRVPRGGKDAGGVVIPVATARLYYPLDQYLWVRTYPDGSVIGFNGYISELGGETMNTDDNAVEMQFTIKVSGRPVWKRID